MQPRDLMRDKIGIDDLLDDIPNALHLLKRYLDDDTQSYYKIQRARDVEFVLVRIVTEGGVKENYWEFELMDKFSRKELGKPLIYYITKDVTLQRTA